MRKILTIAILAFLFTSCYNTRIMVGDVSSNEDELKQVHTEWTHHFLFGLIPGGNANANPADYLPEGQVDYMVKTNQSFWNGVVGSVTAGIYTPTQTKYYVPYVD
jgi:hypothetical protein